MGSEVSVGRAAGKCHVARVAVTAVGFSYTSKCNYSCEHCSVECSPERREKLDPDAVLARIDEAAGLGVRQIAFTGGECMLYADEILAAVKRASDNGQPTTVTTNGFWAASSESAYDTVGRLKSAGLKMLEISYDALHERAGARMAHVDNILAACRRWGMALSMSTLVQSAWCDEDRAVLANLKVRGIEPSTGAALPYGAAYKRLPMDRTYYRRFQTETMYGCHGIGMLNYAADGFLLPCCGQGVCDSMKGPMTGHLVLGKITDSLAANLEAAKDNLFLLVLAVLGPQGFVHLNEEYGNYVCLPQEIHNPCDVCIVSSRDEGFRDFLTELAKDREAIVRRIYRCHDVLNRWGIAKCELVGR
jgi:hypothetical protein